MINDCKGTTFDKSSFYAVIDSSYYLLLDPDIIENISIKTVAESSLRST